MPTRVIIGVGLLLALLTGCGKEVSTQRRASARDTASGTSTTQMVASACDSERKAAPDPAVSSTAASRSDSGSGARLDPPPRDVSPKLSASQAWSIVTAESTLPPGVKNCAVAATEELALYSNDVFKRSGAPVFQNVLAWVVTFHGTPETINNGPAVVNNGTVGPPPHTTAVCETIYPVDASTGALMNVYQNCE